MSMVEQVRADPPRPAAPPRHRGRMGLIEFLRTVRRNTIAAWPAEAFEAEVMARQMLFRHVLIVNAPVGVQHVLLDNAGNYVRDRLARRMLEPGLGQGLLTSEGGTWRRQRRTMAPIFAAKRIADFAPAMVAETLAMLARWEERGTAAPLDIAGEMMRLTLAIIARVMFATGAADDVIEVARAVERYQETVRPSIPDLLGLPGWLPRPGQRRGHRAIGAMDTVITEVIARRRQQGGGGDDLLALLLAARDDESGGGLSDRELRDQVATIFTAGHETTANALGWAWYLIGLHPEVEVRLHRELADVLGGRPPAYADLPQLTYTRQVLDETLRLYPPAHTLSREALAADEIMGQPLPAGGAVVISPWLIHRHRRLWRDPDSFDPGRFAPEASAGRPRFAYLPFGGGPRVCIGASFAITEAMLILATVAQHYRCRLLTDHPVEPVGLITLRPRRGLVMALERR